MRLQNGEILTVALTTTGRRTHKPHRVTIRLVSLGGRLYAGSDTWSRDWCLNLFRHPTVTLRLGEQFYKGKATSVKSNLKLRTEALEALDLQKESGQQPVFEFSELHQIRVGYYELVETAFDEVAPYYDPHIQNSLINLWMRLNSISVLNQMFKPGDVVLDIGCGTGVEGLELARQGVQVLGVDLSGEMVRRFNDKAKKLGLQHMASANKIATKDLGLLLSTHGEGYFDGAFSNFGALNLDPNLRRLPSVLYRLLRDGGHFVTAVWNRYCLFELLVYAATARPYKALRRVKGKIEVGVRHHSVPSFLYSVGQIKRIFSPYFGLKKVAGVLVFLPPPNLELYYEKVRRFTKILETVDLRMSHKFPFNMLGDHFILTMARQ